MFVCTKVSKVLNELAVGTWLTYILCTKLTIMFEVNDATVLFWCFQDNNKKKQDLKTMIGIIVGLLLWLLPILLWILFYFFQNKYTSNTFYI